MVPSYACDVGTGVERALKPAQPVARSAPVRRYDKHFNFCPRLAVKNVVGEAGYAILADSRRQFNAKSVWVFTNGSHCSIKRCQVSCTQSGTLSFVIGHVLKVFNPRLFTEEITHFSRAWAWFLTSSEDMRWVTPQSMSSARRAASCDHNWAISTSDNESRLDNSCSASSARA